MDTFILHQNSSIKQHTPQDAFNQAFVPTSQDAEKLNTLILFLTRRIVAFARLSIGANPSRRLFWQSQIISYHTQLKQVGK